MRRYLAAAGAAALALAVAVPLAARAAMPDGGHNLSFYQPVTYDRMTGNKTNLPATAPDGAVVYSTDEVVTVAADFRNSGDGIKSWDVVLRPVNGGTPSTCHEDEALQNGHYPSTVYINCPWDTTRAVDRTHQATNTDPVDTQNYDRNWHLNDHGPSVNGKYNIEVTVTNSGVTPLLGAPIPGDQQFTLYEDAKVPRWRQVWVNNDVAAPSGINATYDAGSARINVTWAPNPEPDVSYLVQEKVGDGKWGNPVTVPGTATNYSRAVDQPGKYQYQVAAQRPAPTADSGGAATATKKSAYVASGVVGIDQVTPPTTAGDPNGADGSIDHSGDNGVILPTDAPGPAGGGGAPAGPSAKGGPTGGPARPGATGAVTRPSGPSARASGSAASGGGGEAEGEGPDEGFSSTLPFNTAQDGSADGLGSGDEDPETMGPGFVKVPKPQDARAVLIPMAGALVVFMLAMQLMVWVRRRPATVTAGGDDFDDWMTF
ncbi:MAG TPA: hypothetical protein VFE55_19270 [Acidimicrobiia bacterium]|nr:hypothetical protein [Acidimicrobiia bacterium]